MKKLILGLAVGMLLFFGAEIFSAETQRTETITPVPYGLRAENTDAKSFAEKESITIVAAKGTDLYISPDGAVTMMNTPRIYFEPKGDFALSTKVSSHFTQAYDGAALFVLVDSTDWAKLLFERFDSGRNGLGTLVTKAVSDDAHHAEYSSDSLFLKITRQGPVFTFYWSKEGEQWAFIRRFRMDATQPIKLGFTVQSPTSTNVQARFTDIRFTE